MKRGINLALPKKKTSQATRKFYIGSVSIFVATVVIGIILIAINLFLKNSLDNLNNERDDLKSQILAQDAKLFKLHDTHERLANIKMIVNGRSKVSDKIETISSIIPPESQVTEINGEGEIVAFTITTPDLSLINSLLEERLVNLSREEDKNIQRIEMKSLFLDPEDRVYEMEFEVTF